MYATAYSIYNNSRIRDTYYIPSDFTIALGLRACLDSTEFTRGFHPTGVEYSYILPPHLGRKD